MRALVLSLVVPALAAAQSAQQPPAAPPDQQPPAAQSPATQPPSAPSGAAPVEPSVGETASPEIVGPLVKDLGITPKQAQGAAGTLFGLAKTKLPAADFAKVATAVPNMDGLLKAAPTADFKAGSLEGIAGQAVGLGAVASVAGPLTKLGIKPETMAKLAPSLVKAVQAKGGVEAATILAGVLK